MITADLWFTLWLVRNTAPSEVKLKKTEEKDVFTKKTKKFQRKSPIPTCKRVFCHKLKCELHISYDQIAHPASVFSGI